MGLVIFSGVLVGTVFTLFVGPMFYAFISRKELVQHESLEPAAQPVSH